MAEFRCPAIQTDIFVSTTFVVDVLSQKKEAMKERLLMFCRKEMTGPALFGIDVYSI